LFLRLGISQQQQREALHTYLLETREEAASSAFGDNCHHFCNGNPMQSVSAKLQVEFSVSFPGLKTVYSICEVQCEILNPQDTAVELGGLRIIHKKTCEAT
jgi:hypothetical protein